MTAASVPRGGRVVSIQGGATVRRAGAAPGVAATLLRPTVWPAHLDVTAAARAGPTLVTTGIELPSSWPGHRDRGEN
jgi:hypothetical protein